MNCGHPNVGYIASADVAALGLGICEACGAVLHLETLNRSRRRFTADGAYELAAPETPTVPNILRPLPCCRLECKELAIEGDMFCGAHGGNKETA